VKTLAIRFLGLALAIFVVSACGSRSQAAGQAGGVKATKGQVLVTNSLGVDFSAYKVTFIELGADRCIPCREMQPIMREIAAEFPRDVQVVFYDVWKDPAPARKYGIQLIPTQVFVDQNGKEFHRHVGLYPKEELVGVLIRKGVKK
jgi:thioredoxin 1